MYQFLLAHMLSVEQYGVFQSLLSLVALLSIASTACSMVLVKYVAHFSAQQQIGKAYSLFLFFTKKLSLALIFLLGILALFSAPMIRFLHLQSFSVLALLGGIIFISVVQSINDGTMRGLHQFTGASVISVIVTLLKIVFAWVFVRIGFAVNGALGALIAAAAIGYALSFIPLRHLFSRAQESIAIRPILRYFFPVLLAVLFSTALYTIDVILVKHFFSTQAAGEYAALALLGHVVLFISGPLTAVMFPMTSAAFGKKENPNTIFIKTVLLTAASGAAVAGVYFCFSSVVIQTLVGEKFMAIQTLVGWFTIAMVFCALINVYIQYFLSIHRVFCLFIVGVGIMAEIVAITLWHDTLWQVVMGLNAVMVALFLACVIYYVKVHKLNICEEGRTNSASNLS